MNKSPKYFSGAGEKMAQQLGILAALIQDPGLVLSTRTPGTLTYWTPQELYARGAQTAGSMHASTQTQTYAHKNLLKTCPLVPVSDLS